VAEMKQLVILLVLAAIGVAVYYYFEKPEEFKKIVQNSRPSLNATTDDLYAYANAQFQANGFEEAINYFKKALSKGDSGDAKLDPIKVAEARYKIGAGYDQLDKTDHKMGHGQKAANWFQLFLKYHENHPDYADRARRRLTEIESTGIKGKWEEAN